MDKLMRNADDEASLSVLFHLAHLLLGKQHIQWITNYDFLQEVCIVNGRCCIRTTMDNSSFFDGLLLSRCAKHYRFFVNDNFLKPFSVSSSNI